MPVYTWQKMAKWARKRMFDRIKNISRILVYRLSCTCQVDLHDKCTSPSTIPRGSSLHVIPLPWLTLARISLLESLPMNSCLKNEPWDQHGYSYITESKCVAIPNANRGLSTFKQAPITCPYNSHETSRRDTCNDINHVTTCTSLTS